MLRRHAGNDPKAICVQSARAPVRAAARPVSQPPTPGRSAAGDAWNCAPLPAESRVVSGRRVSDKNGLKPCLEATKKRLHHNVLAIALANERAGIACSIRWNGCRKFCFDLIVPPRRLRYRRGGGGAGGGTKHKKEKTRCERSARPNYADSNRATMG